METPDDVRRHLTRLASRDANQLSKLMRMSTLMRKTDAVMITLGVGILMLISITMFALDLGPIFPIVAMTGGVTLAGIALSALVRLKKAPQPGFSDDELASHTSRHFRDLIEEHREKVLGEKSEFNQLRVRIEKLKENALSQEEYWKSRADLRAVDRLETLATVKCDLAGASDSLAHQREQVLAFFRTCEAQVRKLESGLGDYFADQRLETLVRGAGEVTRKTHTLALSIAAAFIEDTRHLQSALEHLHEKITFSLSDRAEDVSVIAAEIANFELVNIAALEDLERGLAAEAIPALKLN